MYMTCILTSMYTHSGVIVTFVFGFILLILCAIFFFFGSNAQKLCQAVEAPNYPVFEQVRVYI